MVEEEVRDRFPKSYNELHDFFSKNAISNCNVSTIIYYLDSKKLFIGITTGDGEDWICELNGLIIDVKDKRVDAEEFCINEALQIIEKELNKTI